MSGAVAVVRRGLFATGAGALALGLLFVAVPDLARALPQPWPAEWFLVGFFTAAFTGGTVVGQLHLFAAGERRSAAEPDAPAPERVHPTPVPGAEAERWLEGSPTTVAPFRSDRRRVRARLRRAAVSTVARTEGCSRAEAERRVETGTWTDDPVAAAFFRPADAAARSLVRWTAFPWRARRTARAILRRREGV